VRLRAESIYYSYTTPQPLYSFTNEESACFAANSGGGEVWTAIGEACAQPYGGNNLPITVVSSSPTPYTQAPSTTFYMSYGGGAYGSTTPYAPSSRVAATTAYYSAISAPSNLTNFKSTYGYATSGNQLVNAKYYNAGDLGIGRDMSYWAWGSGMNGRACFVTNYGTTGTPPTPQFGLDPQTVIAQVIAGSNPVATVAMVYNPTLSNNNVQFMVFDGSQNLTDYAALDNIGLSAIHNVNTASNANINIPNNCLTCHGASASFGSSIISGASFLPFDPAANPYAPTANLVFSTSNPSYESGPMLQALAGLNSHVYATHPNQAIQDFLNGAYHTSAGPTSTSTFDDTYVPTGWSSPGTPSDPSDLNAGASVELYNELIKPFCRTCHLSDSSLNWASEINFQPFYPTAWGLVCGASAPMPNSLQEQNRFWASPARAHLTNAFDLAGGCAP
jgi:hypothetical protein